MKDYMKDYYVNLLSSNQTVFSANSFQDHKTIYIQSHMMNLQYFSCAFNKKLLANSKIT